jgi:hypothetical protein
MKWFACSSRLFANGVLTEKAEIVLVQMLDTFLAGG